MTRARGLVAGLSGALALTAVTVLLSDAHAAKVANPGSFNVLVSDGLFRINNDSFTFDSSTPITFAGTINSAGSVNIPQSGISFPTLPVSAGGFDLDVHINPAAAMTGTLDPNTGNASLR